MVASQATMDARVASPALTMASQMESMAAKRDWQRTEQLAAQISDALMQTPEGDRGPLIVSIRKSLERVQTLALSSHAEVSDKLSGIRRGRAATVAYGQTNFSAGGAQ